MSPKYHLNSNVNLTYLGVFSTNDICYCSLQGKSRN